MPPRRLLQLHRRVLLRLLFVYARNGMFADMELQSLIIGISLRVAALFCGRRCSHRSHTEHLGISPSGTPSIIGAVS